MSYSTGVLLLPKLVYLPLVYSYNYVGALSYTLILQHYLKQVYKVGISLALTIEDYIIAKEEVNTYIKQGLLVLCYRSTLPLYLLLPLTLYIQLLTLRQARLAQSYTLLQFS